MWSGICDKNMQKTLTINLQLLQLLHILIVIFIENQHKPLQ